MGLVILKMAIAEREGEIVGNFHLQRSPRKYLRQPVRAFAVADAALGNHRQIGIQRDFCGGQYPQLGLVIARNGRINKKSLRGKQNRRSSNKSKKCWHC